MFVCETLRAFFHKVFTLRDEVIGQTSEVRPVEGKKIVASNKKNNQNKPNQSENVTPSVTAQYAVSFHVTNVRFTNKLIHSKMFFFLSFVSLRLSA